MSNLCSKCGKELKPGAVFCSGCGTSLASGSVADAGAKDGGAVKKPGKEFAIASVVMPIILSIGIIFIFPNQIGLRFLQLFVTSLIGFIPLAMGVKALKNGCKGFLPYLGIALSVFNLLFVLGTLIADLLFVISQAGLL